MAIYVDPLQDYQTEDIKGHARSLGRLWCHLTADTREELHEFAEKVGLKRGWFEDHEYRWHYDLTPRNRATAIRMGAVALKSSELVRLMLNRRRRGDAKV